MCSTPARGGPYTPPLTRPQRPLASFYDDSPLVLMKKNASPEPHPLSLSDTSNLHGWSSNSRYVPQSVPNNRPFPSGRHNRPLARAETASSGLGACMELEVVASRPECSVCMEEFADEGLKVPRNLACGHSYCTGKPPCISFWYNHNYVNSAMLHIATCILMFVIAVCMAD